MNRTGVCAVFLALLIASFSTGCVSRSDVIRVSVASNFLNTAEQLRDRFEGNRKRRIQFVSGSTGKIAGQIRNGAPIDIFLAADTKTVRSLRNEGIGLEDFIYADGILVLFHPDKKHTASLDSYSVIAIANPELAPYGSVAQQRLSQYSGKIVRGENVGHAYQMVRSGAADAGFVALSQVLADESVKEEDYTRIKLKGDTRISQSALLLTRKPYAREFFEFLRTEEAMRIIRKNGYDVRDE